MTSFLWRVFEYPPKWCTYSVAWLVPHETAAISAQVLCTPYNHAPCHFMQSHIHKVDACLAVTCHLHFWQNDRDLLCATAVTVLTWGWNRYRNKSQHRKLTLEKSALTTELSPLPGESMRSCMIKTDLETDFTFRNSQAFSEGKKVSVPNNMYDNLCFNPIRHQHIG